MLEFNNRTTIDASGSRLGLYREPEEDIESFRSRVLKALEKEFEYNKYSFRDSLDYITSNRSKALFTLNVINESYIDISFDGIELLVGEESFLIKEFKFVKDFVDKLRTKGLSVTYLDDSSEKLYLKSSNILPFSTKRQRLNFKTEKSEQVFVNDKNVSEVYDDLGRYSSSGNGNEFFNNSNSKEEWYVKDKEDGYILKESQNEDYISYQYSDFPMVIEWNEFRYYSPSDSTFDYRIKDSVKVLKEDEEETPYILTQEGAKLLNKLYKISNTYWGK